MRIYVQLNTLHMNTKCSITVSSCMCMSYWGHRPVAFLISFVLVLMLRPWKSISPEVALKKPRQLIYI